MSAPIDFYFVCISPWSYLAVDELKRVADANQRTVAFKPIDVGRSWGETGAGRPLGDRPQVLQDYRLVELPRWAAWRDTEINSHPKHFPVPYQLSSSVIIAACQAGADVYPLTRALMRGCWVDELDVSDADTVAKLADALGLDGPALLAAAETQAVADEMSANTTSALSAGAWSVPSFVVDGELFFGQDRLEMIAWRLDGDG